MNDCTACRHYQDGMCWEGVRPRVALPTSYNDSAVCRAFALKNTALADKLKSALARGEGKDNA